MKLLALFVLVVGLLHTGDALARDGSQVRAFRKLHACPATGNHTGACPGWVVDHVIPLCAGGADHPDNMQWQERQASYRKDRDERALCRRIAASRCKA